MNWFWMRFPIILSLLFVAGCGSGGSVGTGNTVFIQSSIKTGTSLIVFANISSSDWTSNPLSFTIKSTPYSTTSSSPIPNSDVLINKAYFKYTPVGAAPDFNPPTVSIKDYALLITPGGSGNIENVTILYAQDLQKIASLGGSGVHQYKVDVTFAGTEVNTGASLSNTISASAFVQVP